MGESTKIQWCDHTFNPWRGCTKIAPGCSNCYADAQSKRNPSVLGIWGPNGRRVVAAEKTWGEPLKWNRCAVLRCEECGNEYTTQAAPKGCEPVSHAWDFECVCGCNRYAACRPRVFCASLADVFEDWQGPILDHKGVRVSHVEGACEIVETMDGLRRRLFGLIDATPNLDWLLVTKRPENVRRMWPRRDRHYDGLGWNSSLINPNYRSNVWLLTSVSDQATYDSAAPHLWRCRDLVPVLGFSAEPLLGPIKIHHEYDGQLVRNWAGCWDWWIVGGESGHGARPCDLGSIRSIVAQCREGGVACFVKQIGSNAVAWDQCADGLGGITGGGGDLPWPTYDPKGGDPSEWPSFLRVREWPNAKGGAR